MSLASMTWLARPRDYLARVAAGRKAAKRRQTASADVVPSTRHIVCVSHDATYFGAQLLILHIAEVLKEHFGFHVTTVLLGDGELTGRFERAGGVVDFSQPSWRTQPGPAVMRARRVEIKRLFAQGARHAICNTSVSGHLVRMLKEEGFQVVALIHELPNLIREFQLEPAVKEIGRWADRVVFAAGFVRDRFLPIAGLDPARAVIRPQGLYRPNPYRNARDEARAQLLADLALAPNARLVVAAGPGVRRKGLDIFCQVAGRVARDIPTAHFIWLGDDTTALAKDCRAWVQGLGLERNIHFRGAINEPDRYLYCVAGCDLYLMTSREDPYPSVILEAMDARLPVVGFTDAGGFTELLEAGAGVLVPFEDREAMAEAVRALLMEPARATRMGEEGQRIIDTRFRFVDYVHDLLTFVGAPRPRVSVVVPNYNYAHYIPSRLGTIIAQTYKPYEIIFLDDNSTDDSVAVAEAILSKSGLPYRILINRVNRGCYFQWLHGIEQARGELVWIAEADDESDASFLDELVTAFEDPHVVLAFAQSRQIDRDGKLIREDYLAYTRDVSPSQWSSAYCRAGRDEITEALAIKNTIPNASGVLMKKPDLSEIRERLLQLRNAGDWLSYVHILKSGSIYFTPKVLNSHRVHQGGVTRGGNAVRHMSEIIQVQEYVRSLYGLTAETMGKIEAMRQHTYEYLELDAGATPLYRDHPVLRRILESSSVLANPPAGPNAISDAVR